MRSLCWESLFGLCGQHTPSLKPLTVMNSHPASLSHLLSWAVYQLYPAAAASCQSLSSSLALHLWSEFASGLSVSSSTMIRGSPVSASNHRDPDSASACRPIGSTIASSSLLSAGIPRPSGYALVSRRPALTSSGLTSTFRPSGSVGLRPPAPPWSSVTPAPSRSSGFSACASIARPICLGPPHPLRHPGSRALCLQAGLLSHLLRQCQLAPCIRQPFLFYGSSLHWLHHGPFP